MSTKHARPIHHDAAGQEDQSAAPLDAEADARDPFLAALAAAEWDDEPYTDEQQALAEAGRQEIPRGETVTLEELKRQLARDLDPALLPPEQRRANRGDQSGASARQSLSKLTGAMGFSRRWDITAPSV